MLCYLRAQVLGGWGAGLEILNVEKKTGIVIEHGLNMS